jgi:hypothetical protein
MMLLGASAPGAVPPELTERLRQLAPRRSVIAGGAIAAACVLVALCAGAIVKSASHVRADIAAAEQVQTTATPIATLAPSMAIVPPASASASRGAAASPPAWSFTQLSEKDGATELDGERVPTMRLTLAAGAEVGVATLATPLPAEGYVIDFDYCTLTTHCPFSCVSADPGFAGLDPLRFHVRPITNLDSVRSPVGQWRHFRSEWRAMPDGKLRVSTWIDRQPFQRVEVAPPGTAQDLLHLRVIMAEVEVARVRVSPLEPAR